MKLYHGSNQKIIEIDLSKSRPAKDFGQAFYLSQERDQAVEMASFKSTTFGGPIVVNEFEFNESVIQEDGFKVLRFESYSEEWARFVLANRATKTKIHDYDIVYGPIANDKVGRQIFNLQAGYIDFETFVKRLHYPEGITFQWAFCTERSLKCLLSL